MRLVLWGKSVVNVEDDRFATDSFEMPAVWLHCCFATSHGMIKRFRDAQRPFFNFLKIGPKPLLESGSR